ncbi:MAG: tetratricopeptide repeat protein [Deltaproteobacteria bacterium]|nr:tetratricopeptide repeat protein [Deltaproteobacteria bacterium]
MPAQRPSLTPEQLRIKISDLEKKVAFLELNPNDSHAWNDLGIMYRQNKQPAEAVAAFDKAIEIEPRSEEPRYRKATVLMQDLNDPEGAIKAWEELLKVNPSAMLGNGQSLTGMIERMKKLKKESKEPKT